jgi:hypothetical protein
LRKKQTFEPLPQLSIHVYADQLDHEDFTASRDGSPDQTAPNPFQYMVDDDLLSMASSKICQPRSTEAFNKSAGLAENAGGPCQCISFLDPFPNQLTSWR